MAERKSIKAMLLGAAIILLAIGVSVAATLYFLTGQQDDRTADESGKTAPEAPAEAAPVSYFIFEKPFITTVAQGERSRYMQVFMTVTVRDPGAEEAMNVHLPLLRSRLLTELGSGDFLTLQTEAGRQALKTEALTIINGVLESENAPAAEQVLFTNFVLQ